jgi:ribosome maturation protein SDO1
MVKQIISKFQSHGNSYEILLDYDKYKLYLDNKISNILDILITPEVFKNIRFAKKTNNKMLMQERDGSAERYDRETLKKIFNTTDISLIAKKILLDGEIQYTTEQRKEFLDKKKKKIINIIASQSIDPRLKIPYTTERIKNVLEQSKIKINVNERAQDQISRIINELKPIIPISVEQIEVEFKIPIKYSTRAKNELLKYTTIKQENWTQTEWVCKVIFYAGLKNTIYDLLNSITKGETISSEK